MTVMNDLICILALILLGAETYLVAKRNRTIKVKGKDDFFTLCLVLLFAMLILQPEESADLMVAMRNMLVLMVIFFSMAVKRGISDRGIEKLCFYIPWDKITKVQIAEYQTSKAMLLVSTKKYRFKLIYPLYHVRKLIYEIQKHYPDVLVEQSLKYETQGGNTNDYNR